MYMKIVMLNEINFIEDDVIKNQCMICRDHQTFFLR